jgi:hypothetical protein
MREIGRGCSLPNDFMAGIVLAVLRHAAVGVIALLLGCTPVRAHRSESAVQQSPVRPPPAAAHPTDAATVSAMDSGSFRDACGSGPLRPQAVAILDGSVYVVDASGALTRIGVAAALCAQVQTAITDLHRAADSIWALRNNDNKTASLLELRNSEWHVRSILPFVPRKAVLSEVQGAPAVINQEEIWIEQKGQWVGRKLSPRLFGIPSGAADSKKGLYVAVAEEIDEGEWMLSLVDPSTGSHRKVGPGVKDLVDAVDSIISDPSHPECALAVIRQQYPHRGTVVRICPTTSTQLFALVERETEHGTYPFYPWSLAFHDSTIYVATPLGMYRVPRSKRDPVPFQVKCVCNRELDVPVPGVVVLVEPSPLIASER